MSNIFAHLFEEVFPENMVDANDGGGRGGGKIFIKKKKKKWRNVTRDTGNIKKLKTWLILLVLEKRDHTNVFHC